MLQELIAGISKIKNDFITGFYLTGSIPLNDFHPTKSDIDFLVLCESLPDKELRLQLEELHKSIGKKFKKPDLSGCYITPDAFNHTQQAKVLCFHEGQMMETVFEMAPISRYELKTTAITLLGTPSQNLPITIELKDVYSFLFENINSYWRDWLDKHSSLSKR